MVTIRVTLTVTPTAAAKVNRSGEKWTFLYMGPKRYTTAGSPVRPQGVKRKQRNIIYIILLGFWFSSVNFLSVQMLDCLAHMVRNDVARCTGNRLPS